MRTRRQGRSRRRRLCSGDQGLESAFLRQRVYCEPDFLDQSNSRGLPGSAAVVAERKYLTWTDDNLLRQVVYQGLREDKPAAEVRRPMPPETAAAQSAAVPSRRPPG
jgi:hypothetical protein